MAAHRADEAARRIGLKPALVLPPVPHAVLRAQHPPVAFAVEHGEVTDREPECAGLEPSAAPLLDE